MPVLGLGVFQSAPEETAASVATALNAGYRHIDTAAGYGNEREVGEGIRLSGVDQDDVFIETKVWVSDYGHAETLHAFEKSSRKLGLDRIDLLILHQPMPQHFERTLEAYRALEQLLAYGKVRSIGVSNFMPRHLAALREKTEIIPAVNQVELHPYFSQPDVQRTNAELGILTQAWSPIGGITFYPGWGEGRRNVLQDPAVAEIANRNSKSPAQVLLRWHLQRGRSVIPKSTNASRIVENFNVFDFTLTEHELGRLDSLNTGARGGPDPDAIDPSSWGLEIPEA
ncbi:MULTISPECIES: aldo/keto reductase [unclassified Arthrobacter]|uniref:aldo/keto reductase n=1 Tax=unclassified Arthrobacter TaxID=235627 RepID=UPI002882D7DB|nr:MULTISPECIES: aldo/keto reductase [unclassified Arthrobacter]